LDSAAARLLLSTLRASYGLDIKFAELAEGSPPPRCRLTARDPSGRVWVIEADDLGHAALELAERVGFDVMDS